jgi:regulatory protein
MAMLRARPRATRPASGESAGPESAREAALKLLERQRRTRLDLARRLREKGFDPATIEPVLDRLVEVGLVDDVEFARAFIAGRWGRRAAGWRRIEQELRARGVSAADVAEARRRFEADRGPEGAPDETAAARRVVEQAGRRYAALDPRVRRQRLTALLLRRGFSYETIEQIVRGVGISSDD